MRIRSVLGIKSFDAATSILSGLEVKKEQLDYGTSLSKIKKNSSINCLDLQHKIRFCWEYMCYILFYFIFAPEPKKEHSLSYML